MKLFGKLLIAVLIIGMALPFTLLKGKDGKPLMSFSNFKMPSFSMPELPDLPSAGGGQTSTSQNGGNTIYQWKDAEGNIQFTTSPPPEGIEYTVKGYDPNLNVIQAVELPEEEETTKEPEPGNEVNSSNGIGNAYSPESIEKLFDDTKNVEKLLNERMKNQDALIGQ